MNYLQHWRKRVLDMMYRYNLKIVKYKLLSSSNRSFNLSHPAWKVIFGAWIGTNAMSFTMPSIIFLICLFLFFDQ